MESEEQLLPLLLKDDHVAYGKLIRNYLELANGAAMKLTRDKCKASVLASAAFVLIWHEREKAIKAVSFRHHLLQTILRLHRLGYPYQYLYS